MRAGPCQDRATFSDSDPRIDGPLTAKKVHILFIGDVVGHPGHEAIVRHLPKVRASLPVDLVVANGENADRGFGLTEKSYHVLKDAGVHVITLGNHAWDKREIIEFIDQADDLVRPANYPKGTPGKGWMVAQANGVQVGVLNLMGRTFINIGDCPFQVADRELKALRERTRVILVDFHGEATSDKMAMAHYLDGQVSAVIGTHTHVQTADEQILPRGTAYLTDAGMTGPGGSILGIKPELVIKRIKDQLPARFEVADGPPMLNAAWIAVDAETGRALEIQRIHHL